jgi:hypothetical protein
MHGSIRRTRATSQASSSSDAITFAATTFKERDQWSRKTARDPRVKLMHRHVLRSLALCARTDKDGKLVIDPTYDDLAEASACHRGTAIRAINVAEEIGIVRKARRSDGRVSNAFELLLPNTASNGVKNLSKAAEKTQEIQRPTVANLAAVESSNGCTAATVLCVERKEVGLVDRDSVPLHSSTCGERDTDRLPVGIDSERDHKNGNSAAGKAAAVHCGDSPAIRIEAKPTDSSLAGSFHARRAGNGNGRAVPAKVVIVHDMPPSMRAFYDRRNAAKSGDGEGKPYRPCWLTPIDGAAAR